MRIALAAERKMAVDVHEAQYKLSQLLDEVSTDHITNPYKTICSYLQLGVNTRATWLFKENAIKSPTFLIHHRYCLLRNAQLKPSLFHTVHNVLKAHFYVVFIYFYRNWFISISFLFCVLDGWICIYFFVFYYLIFLWLLFSSFLIFILF